MVSIAGSLVSKHRNHGFLFPGMLVSEGPDTGVTSPGILTLTLFYQRRKTDPFVAGLIRSTKDLIAEAVQELDEEVI